MCKFDAPNQRYCLNTHPFVHKSDTEFPWPAVCVTRMTVMCEESRRVFFCSLPSLFGLGKGHDTGKNLMFWYDLWSCSQTASQPQPPAPELGCRLAAGWKRQKTFYTSANSGFHTFICDWCRANEVKQPNVEVVRAECNSLAWGLWWRQAGTLMNVHY